MQQVIPSSDVTVPPAVRRTLELFAVGLTTDEVARRIDRPTYVVRAHLKRAIVDLGASSKLEAIVSAIRLGLIDTARCP